MSQQDEAFKQQQARVQAAFDKHFADARYVAEQSKAAEPKNFKSAEDIRQLAKSRADSELLFQEIRRRQDVAELEAKPLETTANPFSHLSQREMEQLSALEAQEAAQKKEAIAQLVSMAQWLERNTTVPANPEAGLAISQWCNSRGLSLAFGNLDLAWKTLQANGALRPRYDQANIQQHAASIESLRALGVDVPPVPEPNPENADALTAWMASQPPPTLANLTTREETVDPFSMPLDEFNALNREPEKDPWA